MSDRNNVKKPKQTRISTVNNDGKNSSTIEMKRMALSVILLDHRRRLLRTEYVECTAFARAQVFSLY